MNHYNIFYDPPLFSKNIYITERDWDKITSVILAQGSQPAALACHCDCYKAKKEMFLIKNAIGNCHFISFSISSSSKCVFNGCSSLVKATGFKLCYLSVFIFHICWKGSAHSTKLFVNFIIETSFCSKNLKTFSLLLAFRIKHFIALFGSSRWDLFCVSVNGNGCWPLFQPDTVMMLTFWVVKPHTSEV